MVQAIKRPGSEDDHSPPSSAEVKNGEAISTLLLHISSCLNAQLIKDRDKFVFSFRTNTHTLIFNCFPKKK
jgi:hypothetical protein